MDRIDILITILTSALVSSLVTSVLKVLIENRQEHRFQEKITRLGHVYESRLEQLKAELSVDSEVRHEIRERRLSCYPRLAELVYRTRNMARELVTTGPSQVLAEEFEGRARELEDCLYRYRLDLERDNVFGPVHGYKNLIRAFDVTLTRLLHYQAQGIESEAMTRMSEDLRSTYENIEGRHLAIIDKLRAAAELDATRTSVSPAHTPSQLGA